MVAIGEELAPQSTIPNAFSKMINALMLFSSFMTLINSPKKPFLVMAILIIILKISLLFLTTYYNKIMQKGKLVVR
jgi:hypothetical protein